MSDQTPSERPTPQQQPQNDEELGHGLTGLSSAWPLYVGESLNDPNAEDLKGPEAAAG